MADQAAAPELVEVRFLGGGAAAEVMPLADAALRVGLALCELEEAVLTFGACETDGYLVRPHATLYEDAPRHGDSPGRSEASPAGARALV